MLVSWIGRADLEGPGAERDNCGPLARILAEHAFDELVILSDFGEKNDAVQSYRAWLAGVWLKDRPAPEIMVDQTLPRCGPLGILEIYDLAAEVLERHGAGDRKVVLNVSSGLPAMQFASFLLSQTKYAGAELIQSSREQGVRTVRFPFEVTQRFVTDINTAYISSAFAAVGEIRKRENFAYRSQGPMEVALSAADSIALNEQPALIVGETGTGKTSLARAIHWKARSARKATGEPIEVDCSLVSDGRFDIEFFGFDPHKLNGEHADREGHVYRARGGTLLLRNIENLSLASQSKLLHLIEKREIRRVGSTAAIPVDFRLIATADADLWEAAQAGRFRAELLYRLAVNFLKIAPLRERRGDIEPICNKVIDDIGGKEQKRLDRKALVLLQAQEWPGNVRELQSVVSRAVLATKGKSIAEADIQACLFEHGPPDDLMARPIGHGFSIKGLLDDVKSHYVGRALAATNGNRSAAAGLIGLSKQALDQWIKSRAK